MNKSERSYLDRMRNIFDDIPLPIVSGSTQSTSINGYLDYASDMAQVKPYLKHIVDGILVEDNCRKMEEWKLDPPVWGVEFHRPGLVLDAIEAWIAIRKKEGWGKNEKRLDEVYELKLREQEKRDEG